MAAHLQDEIPWDLLASNFEYVFADPKEWDITNLYPRRKENQGEQLNQFAAEFAQVIERHAAQERSKYPEVYEPAAPEDVVISDRVAEMITPGQVKLQYPHQFDRRKMSHYLNRWQMHTCYEMLYLNGHVYDALKVIKRLILCGEMDTLLQICSHPDNGHEYSWTVYECECDFALDRGLGAMCDKALRVYLCLNMMYCFPELWDPARGRTSDHDYRLTKSYQDTVRYSTRGDDSGTDNLPHLTFFGICPDQFAYLRHLREPERWERWTENDLFDPPYNEGPPLGVMTFEDFLTTEKIPPAYLHTESDVNEVTSMLREKKLPPELQQIVLDSAEYKWRRTLEVPHDPFHPQNRETLKAHLELCWKLLIRFHIIAETLGRKIFWKNQVSKSIINLWGRSWQDECKEMSGDLREALSTYLDLVKEEKAGKSTPSTSDHDDEEETEETMTPTVDYVNEEETEDVMMSETNDDSEEETEEATMPLSTPGHDAEMEEATISDPNYQNEESTEASMTLDSDDGYEEEGEEEGEDEDEDGTSNPDHNHEERPRIWSMEVKYDDSVVPGRFGLSKYKAWSFI